MLAEEGQMNIKSQLVIPGQKFLKFLTKVIILIEMPPRKATSSAGAKAEDWTGILLPVS